MENLLPSILVAVVAFTATNLDNLVVVSVFFADPMMQTKCVVLGQFLGIGALVLMSVASGLFALAVPGSWIALLGALPMFFGIRGFIRLMRKRAEFDPEDAPKREHALQAKTHSQVLAVTLVTIAHGADNLGVYIPLFARNPEKIPLYVAVFIMMVALSCLLGHTLMRHRLLGDKISRLGHIISPFILFGLGLQILWGARPLLSR